MDDPGVVAFICGDACEQLLPFGCIGWNSLTRLQHQGGELATVNAACVQTCRVGVHLKLQSRIVAEHDVRPPQVALRPRAVPASLARFSVRIDGTNVGQRPFVLLFEGEAGQDAGMNHAHVVRGEIDVERKSSDKRPVGFAELMKKSKVRWPKPRAPFTLSASGACAKHSLFVIAQGARRLARPKNLQHACAVGSSRDQVANEHQRVTVTKGDQLQQPLEFGRAAMYVPHDDGTRHKATLIRFKTWVQAPID